MCCSLKHPPHVKAMEASSEAYPDAKLYRRTSALIDHGKGRSYVVDYFRVEGGKLQDYVYHGFTNTCDVLDVSFQPAPSEKLHDFKNIRAADGKGVWRAVWKSSANMTCVAWNIGQPGERAFVADGWGQRDWKNTDIGATIPYIVRRCEGGGVKTFISLFEGHEGAEAFVRGVKLIDPAGIIAVETALGTDYVMSMPDSGVLTVPAPGDKRIKGHFAVAAVQNGKVAWTFVETGKTIAPPSAPAGAKATR